MYNIFEKEVLVPYQSGRRRAEALWQMDVTERGDTNYDQSYATENLAWRGGPPEAVECAHQEPPVCF